MNSQSLRFLSHPARSGSFHCVTTVLAAAFLLHPPAAQAQVVRTWANPGSNALWSNTGNWTGAVAPVTGDRVTFGATTGTTTLNNDLSSLTLNATSIAASDSALYFQSGAAAYTINGNTLALTNQTNAGGSLLIRNDSTALQTFGLNLNLSASNGQGAEIGTSGDLVFNGTVAVTSASDLTLYLTSSTSRTMTLNGAVNLTSSSGKGLIIGGNISNPGGVYTFNNSITSTKTLTNSLPVTINSGTVNLNASTALTSATGARTFNLLTGSSANVTGGATLNVNDANAFNNFTQINVLQTGATATNGGSGAASFLIGANGWTTSAPISIGTNANASASIVIGGKTGLGASGTATFNGAITALDSTNDRNRSINLAAAEGLVNFNGVISTVGGGASVVSIAKTGAGAVSLGANNTYTGGTTVSGGTLYVNNTTGSGTGTATVAVSSAATLAGSGTILPGTGTGVTVASGGTLASGTKQVSDATHDTVNGTHLTLNNTGNLANKILTVNSGSTLTFFLGAGASTGTSFATPNLNSTYLNVLGNSVGEVTFDPTAPINIHLVDLTALFSSPTANDMLQLRSQNPYLLIQTGTGLASDDSNFANLVTTGGLNQNGYVLGSGTSTSSYNPFNITMTDINGSAVAYPTNGLQLYLYNGSLEVVPEPGTWAMMLAGFGLLLLIQSRRKV